MQTVFVVFRDNELVDIFSSEIKAQQYINENRCGCGCDANLYNYVEMDVK